MGVDSVEEWQEVLTDLGLEVSEAAAPEGESGPWFEGLARFSRHSFARMLLSGDGAELRVLLEIVLGPVQQRATELAESLASHLEAVSETGWSLESESMPWKLTSSFRPGKTEERENFRRALTEILKLSDQFDAVESPAGWFSQLRGEEDGPRQPPEATLQTESSDAPSPFESIGSGEPRGGAKEANLVADGMTRIDGVVVLALGFSDVLAPGQLAALSEGVENHLHTKFDVQARPIEVLDRPELRLPEAARSRILLEVRPAHSSQGLSQLERDLQSFVERLKKFNSYGVDLFEYLGVGDTVLSATKTAPASLGEQGGAPLEQDEPPSARAYSFSRAFDSDEEGGVVLGLGGFSSSDADTLEPGHYTDNRLQRPDAETPLVDLVLRHPGYSDRRIGQVLSILLSIEYHDAVVLAESAPCVIAWGLGLERARSFKEVIESAGAKAVLVEPGTFGEG